MTAEVRITFEAAKGFVDIKSMSEQMKLRLEGTTAEHWGSGWLEWSDDTPDTVDVCLEDKWWGPGREGGNWLNQRAVLTLLLAWQNAGHIGRIFRYPHDENGVKLIVTEKRLADCDTHWAMGDWV